MASEQQEDTRKGVFFVTRYTVRTKKAQRCEKLAINQRVGGREYLVELERGE